MAEFAPPHAHAYNQTGPLRWILSHLARYPHLPLLALLAALAGNLGYSYIYIFVGQAFDRVTVPGWQLAALAAPVGGVVLASLAQGLCGLARNYAVEFLAQRMERNARDELVANLLGKSQTFHSRQRIGDIMARATNDIRALNLMISPGMMLIVDSLMNLVVPIVLIGRLDARLLPVPLVFTLLLAVTVVDYVRRLKPVSIAQREQFGHLNAGLAEAIEGVELAKASARERFELRRFSRNARQFRDYYVRQGVIQARYYPMLAYQACRAAAFFHALWLWQRTDVGLGTVVAFMGLMTALRFPTFISTFSFNLVQLGVASAERILAMLATSDELNRTVDGRRDPLRGEVAFENVSFAFNGQPVLQDITFRVQPGQTVAVVGQTGAGKTTLTRLINRIFEAQHGRVLVDGSDVRRWDLAALRSQVSTIEQDVFLFSRSLADNIAFGRAEATPAQIEEAARQAQIHDFIAALPDGYDTVVGERGVTLSGGQKQRLAIARAFLTDPHILILDDSTSAVDSATEDRIQRAMQRISARRTTFMITHRLSQIRWADHIIVLRRGRVVDQGTHTDLLARCSAYAGIFARYRPEPDAAAMTDDCRWPAEKE